MIAINRVKLANAFAAACLGTGIIAGFSGAYFTANTFIESGLILASLCFLISKYWGSSIIVRRGRLNTLPNPPGSKVLDEILVVANTAVIQPVCLSFLYALSVLFVLKSLAAGSLPSAARIIYDLYSFNSSHVRNPVTLVTIALSLLTLIDVLPYVWLTKIKDSIKWVTMPLKTVAVLVLFISIDDGITATATHWEIHLERPAFKDSDRLSLQKASPADVELARQVVDAYVDVMVDRATVPPSRNDDDDSVGAAIFIDHLKALAKQDTEFPTVRDDVLDGKGFGEHVYDGGERVNIEKVFDDFHEFDPAEPAPSGPSAQLVETISESPESRARVETFLEILNDARKSTLAKVEVSPKTTILKEMLKDFLGRSDLYKEAVERVPFYAFAKEKVFAVAKEKFVDGFEYLLKRTKAGVIAKNSLKEAAAYIRSGLKNDIGKIYFRITSAANGTSEFAREYAFAIQKHESLLENIYNDPDGLKLFIENFPHDAQYEMYSKLEPVADVLRAGRRTERLEEIDFEYLKRLVHDGPAANVINDLEKAKYVYHAETTQSSSAWRDVLDRNPNITAAERNIVLENIRLCRQVEEMPVASATEDLWAEYFGKYPNANQAELLQAIREGNVAALERESGLLRTGGLESLRPLAVESESSWLRARRVFSHIRP